MKILFAVFFLPILNSRLDGYLITIVGTAQLILLGWTKLVLAMKVKTAQTSDCCFTKIT